MSGDNTQNLDNWNPMLEDFEDPGFNSYAGRDPYEKMSNGGMQTRHPNPRISNLGHEVFALHVRKVPLTMTEVGLRNLFSKCGVVLDVKMLVPKSIVKPSFYFGKVYFKTTQEAIRSIKEIHDAPPFFLKVELDRQYFPPEGGPREAGRNTMTRPPNLTGGSRISLNVRMGGRGLFPTPLMPVNAPPECASRTAYTHNNRSSNSGMVTTQDRVMSRSNSQMNIDSRCVKCLSKGNKCCTRCKAVYCSLSCQKADWDQHKFVCGSLRSDMVSRPFILNDPPIPKQYPFHGDNSPKQSASRLTDEETQNNVQPRSHSQGSFHSEHNGEPSRPRQAYDEPTGQQLPKKMQSPPNIERKNAQCQTGGNDREQHPPVHTKNGKQAAGEGQGRPLQNYEKQNHHSQVAGKIKSPHKPVARNASSGQHPQTEIGNKKSPQRPEGDRKEQFKQVTEDTIKDTQNEELKASYQPLRRPNPPQTSAPKAKRPVTPQKLRTVSEVMISSSTKVKISHINDPCNFYVQLDKKEDLGIIMCKVQVVDRDDPLVEVSIGQIVAAKFSLDGVFYRARVENVQKDRIRVNFIDYGNDDFLAMQDLRYLDPEIAGLPVQSVWCRLANVHPPSGQWSADALSCFKVITENVLLHASLVKPCGSQTLITLKEESEGDTGEVLIETGAAVKSVPVHFSCLENWEIGAEIILATPTQEKVGKVWANHTSGIPTDQVAVLFSELSEACTSEKDIAGSQEFIVGSVVAAQSPADEVWYRGVILKVFTEEYLVRYLDYGNCELVKNLRILPDNFCQYLTLGICLRVEEPYATECVPDEFLGDDFLTVKVLQVMGDTATVNVQFGEGNPNVQATASSIWKYSNGFEVPNDFLDSVELQESAAAAPLQITEARDVEPPQATKSSRTVTPAKNSENPCCVTPTSTSVVGKGLELLPKTEIPFHPTEVLPSWVESLDQISVQFLDVGKMTLLMKLSEDLQEACQGDEARALSKLPAVGQLVCCQFSLDGMWNRCLVEEVFTDGNIKVRFIDYGNSEITRLDKLQPLPNSFYDTCPMALTIAMKAVTAVSLEVLREALTPTGAEPSPLLMNVTDRATDPVQAVLTTGDGQSLEDYLVEFATAHNLQTENVADAEAVATAPSPLVEEMEPRVVVNNAEKNASSPKPAANVDVQFSGSAESLVAKTESVPSTSYVQLEVGQSLDLCIGEVHAPELIMVFKCDTDEISKYDKIAEDITEYCIKTSDAKYEPKTGEFCLAKCSAFDQWFRALVTDMDNGCKVLFMDYGNSEVVAISDTRQMVDAFLKTPFQAISCSIFGVESKEDGYSDEECETFKNFLTGLQVITAEVIKKDDDDFYTIRVPSIEAELKELGFWSN